MRSFSVAVATAALAVSPSWALAQSAFVGSPSGEGIGIRVGDLELHPTLGAEGGYDSNYFRRSGDANEPVKDAFRLRVTPGLSLTTLAGSRMAGATPPALKLKATLYTTYNETFPAGKDDFDSPAQRRFDVGAALGLDILPSKPVGGDLELGFVRVGEPSNNESPDFAFDRNNVRGAAGVTWRPGGGLFEWRVGYGGNYTFFDSAAFTQFNNVGHEVNTRERFRFMPRTAILHEASLGFRSYTRGGVTENSSQFVKTRIGVNGLVSNRWALLGMVGWGGTFYDAQVGSREDFDSVIGQAEVRWILQPAPTQDASVGAVTELSNVALGYTRDFAPSYLGNFYRRDRGYLDFSLYMGQAFVVNVNGGVGNFSYAPSFFPSGNLRKGSFNQLRADATLLAEYRVFPTLGINTTLGYEQNLGDNRVPVREGVVGDVDNLAYQRFTAFLGLRWFM